MTTHLNEESSPWVGLLGAVGGQMGKPGPCPDAAARPALTPKLPDSPRPEEAEQGAPRGHPEGTFPAGSLEGSFPASSPWWPHGVELFYNKTVLNP